MKKMLVSAAVLMSLSANVLAKQPDNLNATVCLSNIKAIKQLTDAQCQLGLQKCYTVNLKDKTFKLNDTMQFELKKGQATTNKRDGFTVVSGNGLWKGTQSATNGKPFADKTYFKGIGFANDGVVKGVFADSLCKGEFEAKVTK